MEARFVARVWGWVAWITLITLLVGAYLLSSVAVTFLGATLGLRGTNIGMGAVVALLSIVLLIALGPFTIWALLSALCDINDRLSEIRDQVPRSSKLVRTARELSSRKMDAPSWQERVDRVSKRVAGTGAATSSQPEDSSEPVDTDSAPSST